MSGIRVFNAAINRLQQSQRELSAISDARQRAEREDELLGLKKKKAEIDLNTARIEQGLTENDFKIIKSQTEEYFKQQKKINEGNMAQINAAESQATAQAKQAEQTAKTLVKNDPQVQQHVGQMLEPTNVGGHIGFRPKKQEKISESDDYKILEMANKMASEDLQDRNTPYLQKVQKYIPEARKMLGLGEIEQQPKNSPKIRVKDKNGLIGYVTADKLEEAKRKYGFEEVQ